MKRRVLTVLLSLAVLISLLAGCSSDSGDDKQDGSGEQSSDEGTDKKTDAQAEAVDKRTVYVTPEWVKSVIDGEQPESENYLILETSSTEDAYNEGHIPGAYHCPVDLFESNVYVAYTNNIINYKDETLGNILPPEELLKVVNKYGITKDTTVITYGAHPVSEREAFILLYCGVENVKVLNGDIKSWTEAGYEVETKANTSVANDSFGCELPAHPEYVLSKDEVKENLKKNSNFKLVSIRSEDEFQGLSDGGYAALQEKGEIAGAVFGHAGSDANSMEEYMNDDGTVIPYETFEKFMAESNVLPDNEVCFFCGTGWRATMPLLLGYEKGWKVSLYDGGWWVWSRDLENNAVQMLTPEQAKTCSSFEYEEKDVTLKVGDKDKEVNSISVFPASVIMPPVRFKSDNTDVVTVAEDGKVTAVGEGTATIKMIATDFSGRNTSYNVTVTK